MASLTHFYFVTILGLLNSILDTSKIEAGKMQLEEEEFDLSSLLEDVVDLYHPMAMKKGVEVVLDPCNGSVIKHSRVKGDRRKLKQVLCNLLSNAVKFTDEGHITVRAWTQKAKLQKSKTNHKSVMKHLSWLFSKKDKECEDIEAVNLAQQDPCLMDFVFEVDDTGKGIPKENHKSVFENYVQVKENSVGQVGTGLGLGIVQSLVSIFFIYSNNCEKISSL
jgi:signal transduction histidine kinase